MPGSSRIQTAGEDPLLREPAQRIADRIDEPMHADVQKNAEKDGAEAPEEWRGDS